LNQWIFDIEIKDKGNMVSMEVGNKRNMLDNQRIVVAIPMDGCVCGLVDGSVVTVFSKGSIGLKKNKK
jgi:hypothetical protein